jgi:hypothetical protein
LNDEIFTGGCQCGAVRFQARSLVDSTVCHCRMCQKQFGAFYAPLATFRQVEWTRGERGRFRSSNIAARGFCRDCGTPLSYEPDRGHVSLATGAFDDPERLPPTLQFGVEARLSFTDTIPNLRSIRTRETGVATLQHPDHDT